MFRTIQRLADIDEYFSRVQIALHTCYAHQIWQGCHLQFPHDVRSMDLDGAAAQTHALRQFPVGISPDDEIHDFQFPTCQLLVTFPVQGMLTALFYSVIATARASSTLFSNC